MGTLLLRLMDVYQQPLKEQVDISLKHQVLSHNKLIRVKAGKEIKISDLHGSPQGLYEIFIDPPSYLPVGQFIQIKASGLTPVNITFPVDPNKIVKVNFQPYLNLSESLRTLLEKSDRVLGYEGLTGQQLYDALDDIRRAGLLNIFAKSQVTKLSNGETVFQNLIELLEIKGDRFYAVVPKKLYNEAENSEVAGIFDSVSDALHQPPEGYTRAGSFKTPDRYGNLQITFFRKADEFIADIDIDDAGGLEHAFQVLRNAITQKPTHPYNIHEILIGYQKVYPEYNFSLLAKV
ncbi:MAG: hypothetical protein AB1489_31950 [Acidobacteriota bacterium]